MNKEVVIMPCLDMQAGRVVGVGVKLVDIRDAGDPVECARAYCDAGADELAMLDITATVGCARQPLMDVIARVAEGLHRTPDGGRRRLKASRSALDRHREGRPIEFR